MKIKAWRKEFKARFLTIFGFFRASIEEWLEDKAMRQAAALAFYSIFSLAPLLVIAIAVAGFVFGEQAVQGEIVTQLEDFVGREGAIFVENMLRQVRITESGVTATVISLGTMFFGALVIFSALQDALNTIWGVERAPEAGIVYTIKRRALAFSMILLLGILLLAALLTSTVLSILKVVSDEWFEDQLGLWAYGDTVVIFLFLTLVFSVMYKILPDVEMLWRDVIVGAVMTSLLFMLGEYAIGTYLAFSSVGSIFGAAGTLAVLLLWIYYSWSVVLMGAEMTQVWARRYGGGIQPGANAMLLVDRTRKIRGGRIKVIRESKEGEIEAVTLDELDEMEEEDAEVEADGSDSGPPKALDKDEEA